jgi:hypothetical protein
MGRLACKRGWEAKGTSGMNAFAFWGHPGLFAGPWRALYGLWHMGACNGQKLSMRALGAPSGTALDTAFLPIIDNMCSGPRLSLT